MLSAYVLSGILLVIMIWYIFLPNQLIIEGLNNKKYKINNKKYTNPPLNDDPLYLAKLNSANIEYLHNMIKNYNQLKDDVAKLKIGEEKNTKSINHIMKGLNTSVLGKHASSRNKVTDSS